MKKDANQIKSFLKNLSEQEWIYRSERRWWPSFVFHYTDILNAAKILNSGAIFSRQEAEKRGVLSVSSGSSAVLAGTNPHVQSCVRFYFRPQTPTQFHVEGIRSDRVLSKSRYPDAHCPVPVFFLI
ncbi:DarT ssDNA thymidine ADP-ribosyltransferase family protein [Candidatus Leptofilum sp.]|uniref:DarT ssDNA thymidine ADP-ribosyltransferase family protein n=1 Tax=Candidatus Leptofilum sp. TaxID=3241576 RepID=UPI003B58CB39